MVDLRASEETERVEWVEACVRKAREKLERLEKWVEELRSTAREEVKMEAGGGEEGGCWGGQRGSQRDGGCGSSWSTRMRGLS